MATNDSAFLNIARLRLSNQRITGRKCEDPAEVVKWLGAVQAQDFLGSLWAIGLRTRNASETDIELALAKRTIVRTWPMRGTLHIVPASDVRWMLSLLAPRILARNSARLKREYGLDGDILARSRKILSRALRGGKKLTRGAVYETLESAGVVVSGQRGIQILWCLAHEGLLCLGAREWKQQTFVLMEEWVPETGELDREEALARLTQRYFISHGPATIRDYQWWSGLTAAEAARGLAMVKRTLTCVVIGGQTYWMAESMPAKFTAVSQVHLLPPFDEFTVAYKDRTAAMHPSYMKRGVVGFGINSPSIVVGERVVGTWGRVLSKQKVFVVPGSTLSAKKVTRDGLTRTAQRYGKFLGMPVSVRFAPSKKSSGGK